MFKFLSPFVLLGLLAGCATTNSSDPYADVSAQEILSMGETHLRIGQYDSAIEAFESLEAQYPFGREADQAQLGAIYAFYKLGETGQTLAAADRFIRANPTNEHVAYAYYMKGLANFIDAFPFPERYLPLDPAERDITMLQASFKGFC